MAQTKLEGPGLGGSESGEGRGAQVLAEAGSRKGAAAHTPADPVMAACDGSSSQRACFS